MIHDEHVPDNLTVKQLFIRNHNFWFIPSVIFIYQTDRKAAMRGINEIVQELLSL